MSDVPEYCKMSKAVSDALECMGITDQNRQIRKTKLLEISAFGTIRTSIDEFFTELHCVGSQIEGTTCDEMNSDEDKLCIETVCNAYKIKSNWQQGKLNLLMVEDEKTAPGHYLLQMIDADKPVPTTMDIVDSLYCYYPQRSVNVTKKRESSLQYSAIRDSNPEFHYKKDGCVFISNSFFVQDSISSAMINKLTYFARNGPAFTVMEDVDDVFSIACADVYPVKNQVSLITRQYPCNLVAMGHPESENSLLEWRISYNLTEREIMFNMNLAQIKCYVTLKLLKIEYFKPIAQDNLSSYHCKTAMFHTIATTPEIFWTQENLIACMLRVLRTLFKFLKSNFCPNFFNSEMNLFDGKIPRTGQVRYKLIAKVCEIMESPIEFIKNIGSICDNLYLSPSEAENNKLICFIEIRIGFSVKRNVEFQKCSDKIIRSITCKHKQLSKMLAQIENFLEFLEHIKTINVHMSQVYKKTSELIIRKLKCTKYSLLFANDMANRISDLDTCFMRNVTDVGSDIFKLASIYYVNEEYTEAEKILQFVKLRCSPEVLPGCYHYHDQDQKVDNFLLFIEALYRRTSLHTTGISHVNCVSFTKQELPCSPKALQFEMFRTIGNDAEERTPVFHFWMDWAVIDSIPFMYYLFYLTYRQMGRIADMVKALTELESCVKTSEIFIFHHETVSNLLGKCYEVEARYGEAFDCYKSSLNIRPRNNAAKWHVTLLMWQFWQNLYS